MLHFLAATVAATTVPASTAVQQATNSSSLHFELTLAVIGIAASGLGWFIKRVIGRYDDRYTGLVTELHETNTNIDATNTRLGVVAENLANLTGQLQGMERANVNERQRVQRQEPDLVGNAAQAKASAEQAATAAEEVNAKLDIIHGLVNSNMTASMQAELDATRRELVWMKAVPSPDEAAVSAIALTEGHIAELETAIAERKGAS
jgi:hypothetical protein